MSTSALSQALEDGLRAQFLETRYWHLLGTAATGPVLVMLAWRWGSAGPLSAWLALHLASVVLMAAAYSRPTSLPSLGVHHGRSIMRVTFINGVVMGSVAWFDMDSLRTPAYAYALCAALAAFGAGTFVNLTPLSRMIYVTVLPTFGMLFLALLAAEQWRIAFAIGTFLFIVASRPLALTRRSFEEMIELREEATSMANRDHLTGLLNRRGFLDQVQRALQDGEVGSMFFVDIDNFKGINDRLGHRAGDEVLVIAGQRISARLSDDAVIARIGGDEFAAFTPAIVKEKTGEVAARLVAAFDNEFELEALATSIDASVGAAPADDTGSGALDLLQHADMAMYEAKTTHTGLCIFSQSLQQRHEQELELIGRLEQGLHHDEFIAHFQPICHYPTCRVIGFEALARWVDDGRTIPANEWVDTARRERLMPQITRVVAQQADHLSSALELEGIECSNVGVNVDPNDLDAMIDWIEQHSLSADRLLIELTERELHADSQEALRLLDRAVDAGLRLALDDFGIGWSSLERLRELPFEVIKIDGSFTAAIIDNHKTQSIVGAIVNVARACDLGIIADWVETTEQADQLLDLGVAGMQGFMFGGPMTHEEALAFARRAGTETPASLRPR